MNIIEAALVSSQKSDNLVTGIGYCVGIFRKEHGLVSKMRERSRIQSILSKNGLDKCRIQIIIEPI